MINKKEQEQGVKDSTPNKTHNQQNKYKQAKQEQTHNQQPNTTETRTQEQQNTTEQQSQLTTSQTTTSQPTILSNFYRVESTLVELIVTMETLGMPEIKNEIDIVKLFENCSLSTNKSIYSSKDFEIVNIKQFIDRTHQYVSIEDSDIKTLSIVLEHILNSLFIKNIERLAKYGIILELDASTQISEETDLVNNMELKVNLFELMLFTEIYRKRMKDIVEAIDNTNNSQVKINNYSTEYVTPTGKLVLNNNFMNY